MTLYAPGKHSRSKSPRRRNRTPERVELLPYSDSAIPFIGEIDVQAIVLIVGYDPRVGGKCRLSMRFTRVNTTIRLPVAAVVNPIYVNWFSSLVAEDDLSFFVLIPLFGSQPCL